MRQYLRGPEKKRLLKAQGRADREQQMEGQGTVHVEEEGRVIGFERIVSPWQPLITALVLALLWWLGRRAAARAAWGR
jgi:hypothetical protein